MNSFKDKNVLVTGSTRGIGKAIALKYAEKGANVILHGRSKDPSSTLIDEFRNFGVKVAYYGADITSLSSINSMIREIVSCFGSIDILVNNAGIYPSKICEEVDEEHFDLLINTNLKSAFFITQRVISESMAPQNYGRIVFISSIDGKTPAKGVSIYSAAKAGVISITKSYALEFADFNITSNCLTPGWVETETVLSSDRWKQFLEKIPSRRLGKLSEIAEACCFLTNDSVSYINGEVLDINGGIIMD
ncbi:MAG: SDR family oxidoreductase [Tissierellia bacterium]|nr:SDR family oxidoreductase [Tissierellia bacterium]